MSNYQAPVTDLRFALHDAIKLEPLFARLGYECSEAD